MEDTQIRLTEEDIRFLQQEIDRMQALYAQAQAAIQSVFNFYLTLVTTVVGVMIVLIQLDADSNASNTFTFDVFSYISFIMLLFFTGLVGTVYLSALSGRYAHAARYAHAIDSIRYYLIQQLNVPLPTLYNRFLQEHQTSDSTENIRWWMWILPTGTYQMFIALINSFAFALMAGLLGSLGEVSLGRLLAVMMIVFLVVYNIYNVYSRLVIRTFQRRLHVRIDAGTRLTAWASRE